jgi:hydroxymethylglutaryl-CoA lyase
MSTSRSICRRLVPVLKHGHRRAFSVTAAARATEHVRIVEVGPRDGLQNEKATISLETKLELIRRLAQTGLTDLEAGSFVAPKWVPQVRYMI